MGKARTNSRGKTVEQQLRLENQQLKKQISSLRKQLMRIDLDRYSTVKDMIEECYTEEKLATGKEILENIKKQWLCKICEVGHLEIFIYNRAGQMYYYRVCSEAPNCANRTLGKPYTAGNVKGIIRKGSEEDE
jgi:hypothetical protein